IWSSVTTLSLALLFISVFDDSTISMVYTLSYTTLFRSAPAGAVAREHGEVVEMNVGVAVGGGNLVVVDLAEPVVGGDGAGVGEEDRKSTRLNSSHVSTSYAVFCLKKTIAEDENEDS